MDNRSIRVLIADDHAIVRKGIKALLDEIEDIDFVGEASNGMEAVDQSEKLKPDIILMDLEMPVVNGVQAIKMISTQQKGIRIIALTSFATDDKVFPAIKNGAQGYLLKDSDPAKLIEAIRKVHKGEPSLSPTIARKVLNEMRRPSRKNNLTESLSTRELEVLRLLAKGLSNQEIAEQLKIAEVTVRTHVSHILDKLHISNRVQATLYALREDLASLEDDGTEEHNSPST